MTSNRQLSAFDLTMIVISLVIGMGIFRTASTAARAADNAVIYLSAWIAGGIVAFCGALTFAEIGSRFPVTGGYYRVLAHTYHPAVAFSLNAINIVSNASTLSGIVLIGAGYISRAVLGLTSNSTQNLIGVAALVVFTVFNLFGIKQSTRLQNVLMTLKMGMILFLIFPLFSSQINFYPSAITMPPWNLGTLRSFGIALVAVSFTYGGYQQTINFGGEVKNPHKIVPKSIFWGILTIIVLYLLLNLSYIKMIGFEGLKSADNIAAAIIGEWIGAGAGRFFAVLLFCSVLAYVNVLLLSNPRIIYAMSRDEALPAALSVVTKKKQVPIYALLVFASLSIVILVFAGSFEKILNFSIFLDSAGMILSASSVFKLRRAAALSGTEVYAIRWFPLVPVIFIGAYAFVAVSITLSSPVSAITGTLVAAFFAIMYLVVHRK